MQHTKVTFQDMTEADHPGDWLFTVGVPEAEHILRVSAFEMRGETQAFRYLRIETRIESGEWVPLLGVELQGVAPLITALVTGVLNAEIAKAPKEKH